MPDTALEDGDVYTESFHEANVREQVVTTCTSVTRPTGVEGRIIFETDTDLEYTYNGSGWVQTGHLGQWTTYTPQIDQGASTNIAKTVNYSRYTRHGRMVTWAFQLSLTASGSAGSNVTITLPVTAASSSGVSGSVTIYDLSTTTRYSGQANGASAGTTCNFIGDWSSNNAWGNTPNLALASGDIIRGQISYEAA